MAIRVVKVTRFQLLGRVNAARRYADRALRRFTAAATKGEGATNCRTVSGPVIAGIGIRNWTVMARTSNVSTRDWKIGEGSNLEIAMGIVNAHMPHMLNARSHGSDVVRVPTRMALPSAEGTAQITEKPDPLYWTAYDLHMIERDARAMRRARVYSMIATYGARLSQVIANGTRALWKNRRQPSV